MTLAPASPMIPPVSASTTSCGWMKKPVSTPLPTVPKPCLLRAWPEKFSSLVSWMTRSCLPATRPPVALAVARNISSLVTLGLRKKRPNRDAPAREPPSLRRQQLLFSTSAHRKSRPPFEPFVAERPQFAVPGHCRLPADSLSAGNHPSHAAVTPGLVCMR